MRTRICAPLPTSHLPRATQALELRPDFPDALCNLVHTYTCVCNWADYDTYLETLRRSLEAQLDKGACPATQPFHCFVYPFPHDLVLRLAQAWLLSARRIHTLTPSLQPF